MNKLCLLDRSKKSTKGHIDKTEEQKTPQGHVHSSSRIKKEVKTKIYNQAVKSQEVPRLPKVFRHKRPYRMYEYYQTALKLDTIHKHYTPATDIS